MMKSKFIYLLLPLLATSVSGCIFGGSSSKEEDDTSPIITKDEFWNEVDFRYKNLTYKGYKTENGGEEQKIVEAYFLEDGSMHQAKEDESLSYYWKREKNTFQKISKKGGFYVVTEIVSKYNYEIDDYSDDVGISEIIGGLKTSFDDFSFDRKTQTFTGSVYSEYLDLINTTLKFENKHLVECKMVAFDATYRVEISNHGTTTIDFDGLNYKNNIRLSGRTFGFVSCTTNSILYQSTAKKITDNNQDSTLTFAADGTFELDMKYDFRSPNGEKIYSGTYTFNEIAKTLVVTVLGEGNIAPMNGTLELDSTNYESGAILNIVISSLGFNVVFKIKAS